MDGEEGSPEMAWTTKILSSRDRKKLNSGVRVGGAGCYTFWTKLELATGQL